MFLITSYKLEIIKPSFDLIFVIWKVRNKILINNNSNEFFKISKNFPEIIDFYFFLEDCTSKKGVGNPSVLSPPN